MCTWQKWALNKNCHWMSSGVVRIRHCVWWALFLVTESFQLNECCRKAREIVCRKCVNRPVHIHSLAFKPRFWPIFTALDTHMHTHRCTTFFFFLLQIKWKLSKKMTDGSSEPCTQTHTGLLFPPGVADTPDCLEVLLIKSKVWRSNPGNSNTHRSTWTHTCSSCLESERTLAAKQQDKLYSNAGVLSLLECPFLLQAIWVCGCLCFASRYKDSGTHAVRTCASCGGGWVPILSVQSCMSASVYQCKIGKNGHTCFPMCIQVSVLTVCLCAGTKCKHYTL